MSTWLQQFWLFAFKTAKHWGRGPRQWNAENLGFLDWSLQSSAPSPSFLAPSPPVGDMHSAWMGEESHQNSTSSSGLSLPPLLCRWAIHYFQDDYDYESSPLKESIIDDRSSADAVWPAAWAQPTFEERLKNNLESNDFSNIATDKLPVTVPRLVAAAVQSPDELLVESVGFAIVGRNCELLSHLLENVNKRKVNISGLYPFHLAATYIDGSLACCMIMHVISRFLNPGPNSIFKNNINNLGHTVLDNVFLVILRSHTSLPPGKVDPNFRKDNRYAGDEVDICGRWDVDSECWKVLTQKGNVTVPETWKHKFCHTSVQAISHIITVLMSYGQVRQVTSGLFQRLCGGCGLRMQMSPLHSFVVVTFHLACFGLHGEDLFGALSCLLALLNTIDPRPTTQISVAELLGVESTTSCSHKHLSPAELADELFKCMGDTIKTEAQVGWQVLREVLRHAETAWDKWDEFEGETWDAMQSNPFNPESQVDGHWGPCGEQTEATFLNSSTLGHVVAVVKGELLSYRRIREGEPWVSDNFDLASVSRYLKGHDKLVMPLTANKMLQKYCTCGRFGDAIIEPRDDVLAFHFSNMEDWERTTILDDRRWGL
jgi:hypothetical protein